MAAKLTFEAKMQGMDQVLEMLKRAESQMNDLGRVGSYAMEGVSNRMKEFTMSLETITKSQAGMGGLFRSFDELNKKANDFLGKSYKGIVDGMKAEVKAFEGEVDKIKNKVTEAERELENFKSRRGTMDEREYQAGISSRQTEAATATAQAVAMRNQQYEMQRQVFMQQQIPGIGGAMNAMGLGQYNTVGQLLNKGIPYAAMAPLAIGEAMQGIGNAGLQYGYTREVDAYLAQARLRRSAAAMGQQGDITLGMLQETGAGVEKKAMDSAWTKAKLTGTYLLDNPLIRALAGAGGGFLAGSEVPIIGNIAGAIAGGIYGFTSAKNRSYSQIQAEQQGELRQRDIELYGILGKGAGDNFTRESQDLDMGQRMFGMASVHQAVGNLAGQGISMDRGNPLLQMLISNGMNPNAISPDALGAFGRAMPRFGVSDAATAQLVRSAAIGNGSLGAAQYGIMSNFASAGLTGADTMPARAALGDYVSSMMATHGAGQDFGTVGAGVSAAIGANQGGFNKTEGVQQGIMNSQRADTLINSGTSGLDMVLVSKLRSIGVTNAVAIDSFIKMGVDNPRTQQAIANYIGKDVGVVKKALADSATSYTNMMTAVLGKAEVDKFNKATGGDQITLLQSGRRAFENTTGPEGQKGATFAESLAAQLGGTGSGASINDVQAGAATRADIKDTAQAAQQRQIDESLKTVLEGTGKTVTDALTGAIVRGFQQMADEVKSAGDRIGEDKAASSKKPFTGVKIDTFSRGGG
jgi:hypothetical protein